MRAPGTSRERRRQFGHSHGPIGALPAWEDADYQGEPDCSCCDGRGWMPATEHQPDRPCRCARPKPTGPAPQPSPYHLARARLLATPPDVREGW